MEETIEEKAKRLGVPVIPAYPVIPVYPVPDINPNPIMSICGLCGLELRQVMGYYCPRTNCPTGLGSTVS